MGTVWAGGWALPVAGGQSACAHPGYGAGLAAELEAGPHVLFGCGPALAWHHWG
jgi:hypothetical protein